jgi:hypothetical protein
MLKVKTLLLASLFPSKIIELTPEQTKKSHWYSQQMIQLEISKMSFVTLTQKYYHLATTFSEAMSSLFWWPMPLFPYPHTTDD